MKIQEPDSSCSHRATWGLCWLVRERTPWDLGRLFASMWLALSFQFRCEVSLLGMVSLYVLRTVQKEHGGLCQRAGVTEASSCGWVWAAGMPPASRTHVDVLTLLLMQLLLIFAGFLVPGCDPWWSRCHPLGVPGRTGCWETQLFGTGFIPYPLSALVFIPLPLCPPV